MAFGMVILSTHAFAGGPKINIGALDDYLPGNTSSIMKQIRNEGDETGFLKIEVKRITFDAHDRIHESPQADDGTMQNRLIVSPNRLIVPPNGARGTRMLYVGKRDEEQYFRVRYLPVAPSRKAGFDVSPDVEKKFADAGVSVMIGYGEFVTVRPTHERYDTVFRQTPGKLVITNRGNSTVILERYRVTAVAHDEPDTSGRMLVLPGRQVEVATSALKQLDFDLLEGEKTTAKHFAFAS
jgi:P pilus assembly chaperone PapD